MNKKFRFVGATAAALLAVAPVATSAIAPAATVFAKGDNSGKDVADATDITLHTIAATATPSDKVADYETPSSFNWLSSLGTNAGISKITITKGGKPVSAFIAGQTYTRTATVSIGSLDSSKYYSVNGATASKPKNGVLAVKVTSDLTVSDPTIAGVPFFQDNETGERLDNGATAYTGADALSAQGDITKDLIAAKESVSFYPNGDYSTANNAYITTTASDVAYQLANQGITVTNGKYNANSNLSFDITLTGVNNVNGKTSSVKIHFSSSAVADYSKYPIITYKDTKVQEGKQSLSTITADRTVAYGSKFNATDGFTATTNQVNKTKEDIAVVSNPVDTKVPGVYTVKVSATNADGYKTTYSYKVTVKSQNPNAGVQQTVDYIPGYGVNVWAIYGDNSVAYAGSRVQTGDSVATFDTKTVNGISYTRIGSKTANTWIQTKYFDGSWNKPQPKPDNGETKVSGVATVTYKGAGKVRLVNSNGKYVSQYVSKGSHWKVFAKKTINGSLYYRIGSESQWVPAKYVSVK